VEKEPIKLKESSKKQWMVVYTRSRFEKKIDKNLKEQNVTSFCPVVKSQNKWADRMKTVETPLFSSYLFVKINPLEFTKVRGVAGVINFVNHCGKPVIISDSEIERIELILSKYSDVELVNLNNLSVGDRVKIKNGVLLNVEGIVNRIMGKLVLMTIEPLECALVIKVGLDQIALKEVE
jgi:transcription antitermination factor NusG